MGHGPAARRRTVVLIILLAFVVSFVFVGTFRRLAQGTRDPEYIAQHQRLASDEIPSSSTSSSLAAAAIHPEALRGPVIAPKLGNETAKAELGRAAWKLFHTTFARFPDNPTAEESAALKSYIYLFQRLYPCGECAGHFGQILDKFPPQVSSRKAAAGWGCHVHNEVNKSLEKPVFDCNNIGDFYDCGCGDDESEKKQNALSMSISKSQSKGSVGHQTAADIPEDEQKPVELAKEGYQRGG